MKRTSLAVAALFALGQAQAGSAPAMMSGWLDLIGVLPAPVYDPEASQIPRRRPGHPWSPRVIAPPQNPDALDPAPVDLAGAFIPVPDRWRIVESIGLKHPWHDPYNHNVLKADRPFRNGDEFFNLSLISDTIVEPRSIPTPVGPQATSDPGALDVQGDIDQVIFAQTLIGNVVYYIGDTTFKPPDHEFRATLAFNYNHVRTEEARALLIDPRRGRTRTDRFVGVQELWYDKHLRDVSARYDFDSLRIGIQPFNSDFRGFLYQDSQPGIRLFGNRNDNRLQYNLAWFRRLDKDINSGLNDVGEKPRKDDILLANVYRQDWPMLGFTSQLTLVYNRNREDEVRYDSNGFIQRPASLGGEYLRTYDVGYIGYNGDGHLGRVNLTVSAYAAIGHQTPGVFIDDRSDIRAGFLAAEASVDFDWIRVRGSLAWASGDDDPYDTRSNGFDSIFENPVFAGADTSYWVRQNIPLIGGGGVALAQRNSLLASLRSSRELGQSNFDNPGLRLIGLGADFDLTPESRVSANINELWFDKTEVLEAARAQAGIGKRIGTDVSVAWIWRPFMTQNIVLRLSGAALLPGSGFKELYGTNDSSYYTVLGNLILAY